MYTPFAVTVKSVRAMLIMFVKIKIMVSARGAPGRIVHRK